MTEMLQSIKSDLLSRRLLPVLVLLAVALVAAVGYALGGGSGSGTASSTNSTSASTPSEGAALHVVVASASSNEALAETPGGVRYQSTSPTRDPFTPLPSPPEAKPTGSSGTAGPNAKSSGPSSGGSSSTGSPSSPSSSGGSGSGGSGSAGGSAPTPAPKQAKPKSQPASTVTVLFGLAPATPAQTPALTTYSDLKPQAQLPSKQNARILFERVSGSGKGAIFKFVLAPILHGQGQCLPSTSECEALELTVGQTEELEYVEANGQIVVYQLKLAAIAVNDENAASARVAHGDAAHVAHDLSAGVAAGADDVAAAGTTFDTVGPTSPSTSR